MQKNNDYHPSYGYATKEEFERLKAMGEGPAYRALLKKINARTKKKASKK